MRLRSFMVVPSGVSLFILALASVTWSQDASSWVGTYEGTWKTASNEGGIVLVIERVEGNKVFGTRTTTHPTLRSPTLGTASVVGTVEGDTATLVGVSAPGQTTLTRKGDELTGPAVGAQSSELRLKKVK
jgi:hypothetical protein